MWLKDPKTKEPSVTLTLLVMGFSVATAKLSTSGLTYGDFTFGEFGGGEYSLALGALGGLYAYRRKEENKKKRQENK